jgi:energy-coupling factor transport system ATP-binding protein
MAYIELNEVSFRYPDAENCAIQSLSLSVEKGDFVVIGGPSGCGKTTLLKLLKEQLTPVGQINGRIQVEENEIGYVFQNPENQIVMDNVLSELVFGLENQQMTTKEMRQRVAEMVHFFGMEHLLNIETQHLSGGQKQLLNVASVLLLKPGLLLLDEPTSQLDPVQSKELIQFVKRLNEEFGMTIILVEHRLEELFAIADTVILMDEGKIAYEGQARSVISRVWNDQHEGFLPFLPSVSKLFYCFREGGDERRVPLSVKEGQRWLSGLNVGQERTHEEKPRPHTEQQKMLQVKGVSYKYHKQGPMVLKNVCLDIEEGDFLAVVGGNGSGKTTLLKVLSSISNPFRGKVKLYGESVHKKKPESTCRIGYLPQNPLLCFMCETLEEEFEELASRFDIRNEWNRMEEITRRLGIADVLTKHIHDCSGGEQQKAALATVLFINPDLLLIDEPTKGMDALSKIQFSQIVKDLHGDGMTIMMVTHDIEFAASHATRCAWLFDGMITAEGNVRDVLNNHYFYTTSINRVSQNTHLPTVLTLEEACDTWKIPALY